MNKTLCLSVLSCCFILLGCSKVEYDFKSLGFSSVADMQAAFERGYHTKKKLDEMEPSATPPEVPSAAGRTETLPVAVESKPETVTRSDADSTPFAPSFDCSKASNKVERLICDDRELSVLDVELSKSYQIARETSTDKEQLKRDQISWVKLSRACEEKSCVKSALEMRLKQLKK